MRALDGFLTERALEAHLLIELEIGSAALCAVQGVPKHLKQALAPVDFQTLHALTLERDSSVLQESGVIRRTCSTAKTRAPV